MIKQGWQRAALFLIIYTGIYLLAGIFFTERQTTASDPGSLSNAYPFLLFSFVVSVVMVIFFTTQIDRKTIASLGIFPGSHYTDGVAGLAISIAILGAGSLIMHFGGYLSWADIVYKGNGLFAGFILMALVAAGEELVFRGYILGNLMDSFSKWYALIISAAVFALFHFQNSGMDIIPFINVFAGGLLLGINFIYTRNLWFSLLLHFGWNFIQGPVLGFPVSGISMAHLLIADLHGSPLMTGGIFGFEGSIIGGVLTIAALLLLARVYQRSYTGPEIKKMESE